MKYIYYPGCSLEGTAREYDISTRAFMRACGSELMELEDWTCCGASAVEPTSHLLSLALPARNLALAEKAGSAEDIPMPRDIPRDMPRDIMVPCSACYLNLKKVEEKVYKDADLLQKINTILAEDHLKIEGTIRVRHLLDVIVNDVGVATIQPLIKKRLEGLVIAPYYGCQCLRPYSVFDDPENPVSMEPILNTTGATIHSWDMAGRCCGASHMNTKMEVGVELVSSILKGAKGADAIVTVCPMCQMNLDAYQKSVSRASREDVSVSVLYLPQLIGLSMGLSEAELGINLNLSITEEFQAKLKRVQNYG